MFQQQPDQRADDHRPVPEDVDPVGQRHQPVPLHHERLHLRLAEDAERALDADQRFRVRRRQPDTGFHQATDKEVEERAEGDHANFAKHSWGNPNSAKQGADAILVLKLA